VWLGFNQAFVSYERDARHAGRTHFPFFSRNPWKTFALGVTSFSFAPIYVCIALALVGAVASTIALLAGLAMTAAGASGSLGVILIGLAGFAWATIVGAIAAVGVYVIRIYKDVRGRPPYIVSSTIGLSTAAQNRFAAAQEEHVGS
jgi:dolichol-phosphate mannosyltransferase